MLKLYTTPEPISNSSFSSIIIKNLAGFAAYRDLPTGDKARRADPFSVQVNWGNVYLMYAPWNNDFIEEYRSFPFGNYKDQVDAGSMAFNRLTSNQEAGALM